MLCAKRRMAYSLLKVGWVWLRGEKGTALKDSTSSLVITNLLFAVLGCGGQTETSATLEAVASNTGGTPASGGGPLTNESTTSGGNSTTDGQVVVATGGRSASIATGGSSTSGATCDTNYNWSICAISSGGSMPVGTTSSAEKSWCIPPTGSTYVKGNTFAGYAFSFISLSPTNGDNLDCSVNGFGELCTSGRLDSSDVRVSAVGVNLNQSSSPSSPANPLAKQINSVTIGYMAASTDDHDWFRVQVNQGADYYCYDVASNTASANDGTMYAAVLTIQANQFNSECWLDGNGTAWDGMGATGIQLTVVSLYGQPLDYDVCLNSLTIN